MSMNKEKCLSSEQREVLNDLISSGRHYLNDFIDEIPNCIISGGYFDDHSESNPAHPASLTHKCQRNWFTKIVGWAGTIPIYFPEEEDLCAAAKEYETIICARSHIDILDDPHYIIDGHGRYHRLTTPQEIQKSNEFLKFAIERLEEM